MQHPAPRVSVVIAAYNAEASITDAIASVRSQTEQATEIIVVDDCSQDGTAERVMLCAGEDRRVKLVQLARNQGPGAARNAAIEVARGDWIALLDADDTFQPNRLQRLREFATLDDADIVSDDILLCEAGHAPTTILPKYLWPEPRRMNSIEFLAGNKGARGQRRIGYGFMKPIFRREFLMRENLRFPSLYFAEDYIFYLRCLLTGARWLVVPEPMYIYYVRENSLTANFTPEQLASVVAADAQFLKFSSVRTNPLLRGAILRHKAAAEQAIPWMSFVLAMRRGDCRSAISAALSSPWAFFHVTLQILKALPRNCRRLTKSGDIRRLGSDS